MPARLRKYLTFANVASGIALFVSIGGGTAFAVVAANQVNSQSIVNGQVKNPDLAPDSVGTGKIGDGKVWVLPVEGAVRVRTGDQDEAAL